MSSAPEKTRKIREKAKPYTRKPRKNAKDAPKTSAMQSEKAGRENLTLSDWLTVLNFLDDHPSMSQGDIVSYFKTKADGALHFTQSSLSRKIRQKKVLEERATSTPNALSSKRPRIVTRPDVERALILWVRHMEEAKETVTGPMLRAKREKIEEMLGVPEEEHIRGDGWIAPFCKAYNIKEHRRHGEAGSVDLEAVNKERERMQRLMKAYRPEDQFNFDETSLFLK